MLADDTEFLNNLFQVEKTCPKQAFMSQLVTMCQTAAIQLS